MHKTCTALHVVSALALITLGFTATGPSDSLIATGEDNTAVVNAWGPILIGLFQISLKILELYGIRIFDFIKRPDDNDDDNQPYRPVIIPCGIGLLSLMALTSITIAGQPRAVISGPSAAAAGDQISLSAKQSIADLYRWTVTRRTAGPVRFSESDDRAELQLNSYPGIYDVTLMVANSDGIDIAQSTVTVFNAQVPGPAPSPPAPVPIPEPEPAPSPGPAPAPSPPDHTPTPDPEPTFPAGRFAVSQKVYDRAKAIPLPARSVSSRMAEQLEAVAASISAGTLKGRTVLLAYDPTPILNEVASALAQTASSHRAEWQPFAEAINDDVQQLWDAGKLRNDSDFATLFLEIASGLSAVK